MKLSKFMYCHHEGRCLCKTGVGYFIVGYFIGGLLAIVVYMIIRLVKP